MNFKSILAVEHKFWPTFLVLAVLIVSPSIALGLPDMYGGPPGKDVGFFFFNTGGQAWGWRLPCTQDDFDNNDCNENKWEAVYLTIEVDNPATPQNPDWVGDTKDIPPDPDAFNFQTWPYIVSGGWSVTLTGELESGVWFSNTLVVHDILMDFDANETKFYGYAGTEGFDDKVCVSVDFAGELCQWECKYIITPGHWEMDLAPDCGVITPEDEATVNATLWDFDGNQTDFAWTISDSTPIRCVGFDAPLDSYPVRVRGNRVLPLRAQLYDARGNLITDADISVPPVLDVQYDPGTGVTVDVSNGELSGQSDEGNQFTYSNAGFWRFNLKTRNYSASGIYTVKIKSGHDSYEIFDYSTCITQFAVE